MRITLLFFVVGLISSCQIKENPKAVISGEVTSSNGNNLILYCHEIADTIILANDGTFVKEFEVNGPTDGYVRIGKESFKIYFEPGKQLGISFAMDSLDASIKFTKELGPMCEYLHLKKHIASKYNKRILDMYRPPNFSALHEVLDSIKRENLNFLNSYHKNGAGLSECFIDFEKLSISYDMLCELYRFPFSVNQKYRDSLSIPSDWFDFKDTVDYVDPDLLNINNALWFCLHDVAYSAISNLGITIDDISRNPNFVREAFYQIERKFSYSKYYDVIGYYFLDNYMDNNHAGYAEIEDLVDQYIQRSTPGKLKEHVIELKAKWSSIAPEKIAYNFSLTDEDGNQVTLADFRGQFVFLDFWTTWCGPCRGDIPHLMELIQKYADKPIVFISISCDKDKTAWENMLQTGYSLGDQEIQFNPMPNWIHLHSNPEDQLQRNYLVPGYPTYIFIDPQGRYVSAPAPSPDDPRLLNLLERVLNSNKTKE